MSERVELPWQWKPRFYQQRLWEYLSTGGKRSVAKWHRRSGKDEVFLHHTACACFERPGNYWYLLPQYGQARKSMWDSIDPHTGKRRIDEAFPQHLRTGYDEHEMKLKFGPSTFQLVGSDNFDSLVGSPPVGLVFSEYALSNPRAWGYLRPILLENGGWAGFNSTPRGKNHFKDLCDLAKREPGWFYEELTADQTQVFTPEQLESELREMQAEHGDDYGRSLWLQEYYTSFDAAVPGSIWGDCIERAEREGRIVDFADNDPRIPVDTGWDLGRTDDTAIWFRQIVGAALDIVDHFASPFLDINNQDNPQKSLVHILLERRERFGWTYGTHWLPHDARPRTLAAGGKSILQQFKDAAVQHPELGRFAIAPRLDRQEGIQAGRATFPRCRFHKTRCEDGIESLRHYHREWDAEAKIFKDVPVHDWASHDADAWRTLALTWKVKRPQDPESPIEDRLHRGNPTKQPLGEIRKHFMRKKRAERLYRTFH